MANVFDVAKYMLTKLGPMTTLKLQKLCYYAQAWSLVWDDAELFPEDFEAWANGPVCPELFKWHKRAYKVSASDVPANMLSEDGFSDEQIASMDVIIRDYGDKTANWLSELTHMEEPWQNARRGYGPGQYCHEVIGKGDMAWYYGSLQ